MTDFVMPLMLGLDSSSLTMSLVNIASPNGAATALADSVEAALRTVAHLGVDRIGDTVIARTNAGHANRVIVVARLDTLPSEQDSPAYVEMGKLFGPGASGAKGALAASLKAAAGGYCRDVTFVYSADDGDSTAHATYADDLLQADFALLAQPTNSAVVGSALDHPSARRLIELSELDPVSDDVATHGLGRFGVPAVAFGPGDPSIAGTRDEFVPTAQLAQCEFVLRQWLTG